MKYVAQFVSVIFHPLLMLTYMLMLLLLVNPYLFGVNSLTEGGLLIVKVFITTFFIPFFAIMMMKWLGLISSLEMRDKQDRIGPFIVSGIFYLWTFRSVLADSNMPTAFLIAALGTTIGLFGCFLINLFFKISLHAAGMGGFIGMVLITIWLYSPGTFTTDVPFVGVADVSVNLVLMLSLFFAGLVGTSRLLLNAHTPRELYAGFIFGGVSQLIALKFLV